MDQWVSSDNARIESAMKHYVCLLCPEMKPEGVPT